MRNPVGESSAPGWFVIGVFEQESTGKMIERSHGSGTDFMQWFINVTSAKEANGFWRVGLLLLSVGPKV